MNARLFILGLIVQQATCTAVSPGESKARVLRLVVRGAEAWIPEDDFYALDPLETRDWVPKNVIRDAENWVPVVTSGDEQPDQTKPPHRNFCPGESSRQNVSSIKQQIAVNGRSTIISTPRGGRIQLRASEHFDPEIRQNLVDLECTNMCDCPVRIEVATPSEDPRTHQQPAGHDLQQNSECEFPSIQVPVGTGVITLAIALLAYYC